jgi:RNA polymerase sigma factor for flagellar operon FliA
MNVHLTLAPPLPETEFTAVSVDELCRTHLALVHYEVRSLAVRLPRHVNQDDLVSAGMAALAFAAAAFDPALGVPFGRFAVRRIRGALLDELRSADWASRSVRTRVRERDLAHDVLAARLGRTPTPGELAGELKVELAELESLQVDVHRSVVLSVDSLTPESGAETLLPIAGETPESVLVARERQAYLSDAVLALPERLRAVVEGYFLQERPMKEIADELGVTESRVSQMRAEALKLLKDGMNAQLAPEMLPAEEEGPVVARRREAYYAAVASQSTYRSRLSIPAPRTHTARPAYV